MTAIAYKRRQGEIEFYNFLLTWLIRILTTMFFLLSTITILVMIDGNREIRELEESLLNNNEELPLIQWQPIEEEIPKAEIPELLEQKVEIQDLDIIVEVAEFQTMVETKTTVEEIVEANVTIETNGDNNYNPTEEEREFAYRVAFGEAGIEDSMGQTLVINAAINHMREKGYSNLIEEFETEGRFSCVINGQVYNCNKIVNLSDVPESVKSAVENAFQYDYSEEILKQQAEILGITDSKYWEGGATYFYNPKACSEHQNSLRENIRVKFQYGHHIFYRYWDK